MKFATFKTFFKVIFFSINQVSMQVYDVLPDAELRCGTGNTIRATDDGFSTTSDADFDVLNIFKTKFFFFS